MKGAKIISLGPENKVLCCFYGIYASYKITVFDLQFINRDRGRALNFTKL